MLLEKLFTLMLCLTIILLTINLVKTENFNQPEPLNEREIERVKDFLNSKLKEQKTQINSPSEYKTAIQDYVNTLKQDFSGENLSKLLKIENDCIKLRDVLSSQKTEATCKCPE